jgi:hypothetical protein
MGHQIFAINNCDILVIARMSPRREARTRRLIQALTRDFRVHVVSESGGEFTRRAEYLDGARLDEITLPFPKLHLWYFAGWLRVIYFNLYTTFVALRRDASTVVCSDALYCLAGIIYKLFLRRKFVYNSHEIMWGLGNPPLLSYFMGWLEKIAIQLCDFWLVPSEERAKLILEKHKLTTNFVVYENFPIIDSYTSRNLSLLKKSGLAGIPHHKPVVMFQGSITPGRGIEELIRSAQSGRFHLIIQGTGRLLDELGKMENKNVTFLDACSSNATVAWLKAADLSFVYYENSCINSAYACSTKFYTSVFAGVPIICNRLPAFQSFADKYGGVVFFETLDATAIEACITKALDPLYYPQLKEQIAIAKKELASTPREPKILQAFYGLLDSSRT